MSFHVVQKFFLPRIALAAALACVLVADVALGQSYITLSTGSSVPWNTTLWTGGSGSVPPQTSTQVGLFNGGGTVTISDTSTNTTPGGMLVGWSGTGSTNSFTVAVTSGTLTVGSTIGDSNPFGLVLGESGGRTGTLAQTGGVVVAPLVQTRGGIGVYNLDSGTLQTQRISSTGGPMTFNFGGGTLLATGTSSTGLTGTSGVGVVVGAGGGTVNNGGFATLMNAPISGTGNLTLAGSGTTTYTANNTHSGTTTLSAGTLRIGNTSTTGNLTGPLVNNAAVIFDRSDNANYTNVISGSGTLTKQGAGTTLLLGPSNTYTGLTTVAAGILQSGNNSFAGIQGGNYDVSANAKLIFSRNGANVRPTSISGAGDVEYQGMSAGFYQFQNGYSGTLSYTGQTIVNLTSGTEAWQGTLWLEKDNVLPNATVVNMQSGKIYTRNQTGTGLSVAGITGSAGTFITTEQSAVQKWTVTVASGSSYTYAGTIGLDGSVYGGNGFNISLTKAGPGTQILSGSNSYTGGTFISSGTLQIGAGGTSGQIAGNVSVTGGSLVFDRSNDISFAGIFSGSTGTVTKRNATTLTLSAESMPFTGSFEVASGSLRLTGTGSTVPINALITGSGALVRDAAANAASSFLILNGSNNYSGGTTINAGFVQLGANNAIGTGPLVFAATTDRGSLNLSGFNQTVAGLTASNTTQFRGDIYNLISNSTSTLTIDTPTGQTFTYANQIGALGNFANIALVKAGAGTQILSGSSRYSGATAVNAGTLIVDGNNSLATGTVTVAAGAVLGGSGTIGGATTVAGTLSPGSSPGVLTIASLVLEGPSTSLFEIDGTVRGTGYDGVTITQSAGLTYGGVLSLAFSNTFADNTTFDLFNFSGSPLGSFSSVTASGPYGSLTFTDNGSGVWTSGSTSVAGQTMTFTQSTGDLVIVPEPGALALAGLGIAAAWARSRRRTFFTIRRAESFGSR
jgi:fibronectin-binding autotransporter adhesin